MYIYIIYIRCRTVSIHIYTYTSVVFYSYENIYMCIYIYMCLSIYAYTYINTNKKVCIIRTGKYSDRCLYTYTRIHGVPGGSKSRTTSSAYNPIYIYIEVYCTYIDG